MPTARKVARKTTATKTKTARKPVARKTTAKTKASAKATNGRFHPHGLTQAQAVAQAVPQIVKKLKAGTTMTAIRAEYGAGPIIREALWNAGYNTKGEKIEVTPINGSGATLAKRVAAARQDRRSWTYLKVATGKTEAELRALLEAHGYTDVLEGRVLKDEDEAPRARSVNAPARKAPVARKTTKAKVARKAVSKGKAKTTAKPAVAKAKPARVARKVGGAKATTVRPGRRVRRVNPSNAA